MPVDIEAHLHDLALQLDRLKVLYEQYFLGLEKTAPIVPRRELEKLLAFLSIQNIGNTGVRFRYVGLVRRWKTYAERWDKILREIENGTYSRHLARVKRKALAEADPANSESAPSEPRPDLAGPRPKAEPPIVPGMSDGELRALHQRYVEALRAVGDAREVRYEGLLASLKKQVPEIMKKNQCDLLTFNVAVKDGKVVLRASPKKEKEEEGAAAKSE